jgi:hypothetical protein
MRVPKNHLTTLKKGNTFSIVELLQEQSERYFHDCMVDGVWCNAMIKRLESDDYLFLISDLPAKKLVQFIVNDGALKFHFRLLKSEVLTWNQLI